MLNNRASLIKKKKWQFSLQIKIVAVVAGVVLSIGIISVALVYNLLLFVGHNEVKERGISIARNVSIHSEELIMVENQLGLMQLLSKTAEIEEDVVYIFITNQYGQIVAHTFENGFPKELRDVNILQKGSDENAQLLEINNERIYDFGVKIVGGSLGEVHLGISESALEHNVTEIVFKFVTILSIVALLGTLLSSFFASSIIVPLRKLTMLAERIGTGDFSVRTNIISRDEIGALATVLDTLVENLEKSKKIIADHTAILEKKVEERTIELEEKNKELERKNKFMVNRELKMIELKKQIKDMEQKYKYE